MLGGGSGPFSSPPQLETHALATLRRERNSFSDNEVAISRFRLYSRHRFGGCYRFAERGVGKSTLARLIAVEYVAYGWRVQIADGDLLQTSCVRWRDRRRAAGLQPGVEVEPFAISTKSNRAKQRFDLIVMDGRPHSTAGTLRMAAAADLVVLPVDLSMDDLEPSVPLAHELVREGIPKQRLAFAPVRVGSDIEIAEAVDYVREAGYFVLVGSIPERTAFRRASDAAVSRKRHSILLTNTPTSWRKQS